MFGLLSMAVSAGISLVFPVYASFKALAANDPLLIRPWLMYWVVLAAGLSAESVLWPVLRFVPFYGLARMATLLWLVLPQTQGAVQLYTAHVDPWLRHHERDIEASIDHFAMYLRDSRLGKLYGFTGLAQEPQSPTTSAFTSRSAVSTAASAASTTATSTATTTATMVEAIISRFRLPINPSDLNVTSVLSGWASAVRQHQPEALGEERNKLMEQLSMLDRVRNDTDHDGYDVIDTPADADTSGASTESTSARKRWW